MNQSIVRLSALGLLASAILTTPFAAAAQTTNKASTERSASQAVDSSSGEKAIKGGPFHGKLAAVDKVAKTITVGKRTFQISSETKIKKAGKPATLDSAAVGETVSGYVKPAGEGKWVATTVNFGPKPNAESSESPKVAPPKEPKAAK